MLEAGRFILTLNAPFWWPYISVVFAQMEELLDFQPACRRAPNGARTSLSAQRAQLIRSYSQTSATLPDFSNPHGDRRMESPE